LSTENVVSEQHQSIQRLCIKFAKCIEKLIEIRNTLLHYADSNEAIASEIGLQNISGLAQQKRVLAEGEKVLAQRIDWLVHGMQQLSQGNNNSTSSGTVIDNRNWKEIFEPNSAVPAASIQQDAEKQVNDKKRTRSALQQEEQQQKQEIATTGNEPKPQTATLQQNPTVQQISNMSHFIAKHAKQSGPPQRQQSSAPPSQEIIDEDETVTKPTNIDVEEKQPATKKQRTTGSSQQQQQGLSQPQAATGGMELEDSSDFYYDQARHPASISAQKDHQTNNQPTGGMIIEDDEEEYS